MDNKNTGMIATVATALLCGCCALFMCIMGFGTITGNGTFQLGGSAGQTPPAYGYVMLCLSFIAILVPVAVWFFTMRKKSNDGTNTNDAPPTAQS